MNARPFAGVGGPESLPGFPMAPACHSPSSEKEVSHRGCATPPFRNWGYLTDVRKLTSTFAIHLKEQRRDDDDDDDDHDADDDDA